MTTDMTTEIDELPDLTQAEWEYLASKAENPFKAGDRVQLRRRSRWNPSAPRVGMAYMIRSVEGGTLTLMAGQPHVKYQAFMWKMAYGRPIALTGYARSGKDEAGRALTEIGYHRIAFGDIIKRRLVSITRVEVYALMDWIQDNRAKLKAYELQMRTNWVWNAIVAICDGGVDPFTEDDEAKLYLRPLLEDYGECFYDSILTEFFDKIEWLGPGARVVNTRLCRVKEARMWREAGGILLCVERPGRGPETEWAGARLQELRDADLIDGTIQNDGTIEELHAKTLAAAAVNPP